MSRVEKYKDVLNDNEEVVKLSTDRSTKYKEIHDEMEEIEKEPTRKIKIQNPSNDVEAEKEKLRLEKQETFMKQGDMFLDLLNKKEKALKVKELDDEVTFSKIDLSELKKKKEEVKKEEDNNEYDDYQEDNNSSHTGIYILSFLGVLGLLVVLCYLFVWPYVNTALFKDSEAVFDDSIELVFNSALDTLNEVKKGNSKIIYGSSLESNQDGVDNFNYNYAIGNENNNFINSVYYNDVGINYVKLDNKYYINYSNSNNMYNITDLEDYQDVISSLNVNKDKYTNDYIYALEKERDILKELVKNYDIKRTRDKLDIGGKKYSVYKNNLYLSNDKLLDLINKNIDYINKDEKLKKCIEAISGIDINDYDLSKYDGVSMSINIYTSLKGDIIGFDLEKNGFRTFYMYFKDYNFNMYLNMKELDYYDLCNYDICNESILLVGKKDGDKINTEVSINGNNIGKLIINSIDDKNINIKFEIKYHDKMYTGDFIYTLINNKYNIDFNINYDMFYKKYNYYLSYEKSNIINNYTKTNYDPEDNVIIEFNELMDKVREDYNEYYNKMFNLDYK